MNLHEAQETAKKLMIEHGLYDWSFGFNQRRSAYGLCSYTKRKIFLSEKLVPHMEEKEVINTILHEIAHALVGAGHGHGYVWQRKALEIGCNAKRTAAYDAAHAVAKYIAECPHCGITHKANRLPKRSHWCRCTGRTFRPEDKLVYVQQY